MNWRILRVKEWSRMNRERRELVVAMLSVILALGSVPNGAQQQTHRRVRMSSLGAVHDPPYAPGEILVRFKEGLSPYEAAAVHAGIGATVVERYRTVENLVLVKLPPGMDVKEAVEFYQQHPDVLYAEPNYFVEAHGIPNDPRFGELWGLHNTGQRSGSTPGADIKAPRAWDITTGSQDVVVVVIDTGIDYTHEDLSANMFRNVRDCNNNNADDDGNGFIDDCYGIDTVNKDSDPMDDNGHGTHVAGTIGAVGNNGIGVVGVNWKVGLMACKFLSAGGWGTTDDAIKCLDYVGVMKDRGVNIIATNNSWGGGGFSRALRDAIDVQRRRGILFIASAGNARRDTDILPAYPAGYFLPNVISVAATDDTDNLAYFSNFGRQTVHLGAPGNGILSTTPGNTYQVFSGTSMAAPHVTGVAALLKAQDPRRDWRAIRNLILASGEEMAPLTETISRRRLDAYRALTCSDSPLLAPLRPLAPAVTGAIGTPVDLAVLHINCARPNGEVTVRIDPGGEIVTLRDNGLGTDQVAEDGIYSGQWVPYAVGTYTLSFLGEGAASSRPASGSVNVLASYTFSSPPLRYRTITGINLRLGDDSYGVVVSPFPIFFGGIGFTDLLVSSNGYIMPTAHSFGSTLPGNFSLPFSEAFTLIAPFWDDLYLDPRTDQNVFWAVLGEAPNRELVIEWRNVRNFYCRADSTATVRFQVVFFEGKSEILFNYADTTFGGKCTFADRGGSATVGIQIAPDSATQFSSYTQSVSDGMALTWTILQSILSVTPESLDFGSVVVGRSADRELIVQNVGGSILAGTASAPSPFSIVSGIPFTLRSGERQVIAVRFAPTSSGIFERTITVASNGGIINLRVVGRGVTSP